jgi:hypothetical protein
MSTRGALPKEPSARRRRNKPTETKSRLDGSPVPPPEFPEGYQRKTQQWWQTWTGSPQGETFLATDWQRLLMLAPLVDQYWLEPSVQLMGEIRLNEQRLGATVSDRLRVFEDTRGQDAGADVEDEIRKRREARKKRAVAE